MNKALLFSIAASGALALAGCDQGKSQRADTAKIAADIKAQEAEWQKHFAAKDADALAGHYAEDATLIVPGDPPSATVADRRKAIQVMIGDPNFGLTFAADRVEVAKSGDLAYSRGPFTMQVTDKATGKPVTVTGTYVTVWQKRDNEWKAVEDAIVPGPAATAVAPAAAAEPVNTSG
ncbi:MAG: YybH family protein [Sphingomicrobium sp.]